MNVMTLKTRGLPPTAPTIRRQGVLAALDIGTSKVSCFIAKVEAGRTASGQPPLRVVGIGHQVSKGIRNGTIVDMEAAEEAIRSAVDSAERMAGFTVRDVIVGVATGSPHSRTIAVKGKLNGHAIGDADIARVLRHARSHAEPQGRSLLHAVPIGYSVDGSRGVRDPHGMFANELGVDIHTVTAAAGPIRNLIICIERCHLDVSALVVSPYASGLATLVEDEIDLGVTVIDLGAGTSSIAVFFEGALVFTEVVPIGGNHITNDLARGLSTPVAHAERMKTLYGSALASPNDEREMIDVPQVGETDRDDANHVPRSMLTGIIQPRLEETFELLRDRLAATDYSRVAGRRVVLTGGASQMSGAPELAARILDRHIRIGRPIRLLGLADATAGPAFATCAGLLAYAQTAQAGLAAEQAGDEPEPRASQFSRFGRWLKENL